MRLNSNKFLLVLKNLEDLSFFKNRKWDKVYSNKTVSYINYEIWKNILNDKNIKGEAIDKYEFNNFCRYYLTEIEINILFNRINKKSRCINFDEFNEFMEFLSEKDYLLCISCLEPEKEEPSTPESSEKEEPSTPDSKKGEPSVPDSDKEEPSVPDSDKEEPSVPDSEKEKNNGGLIKKLHYINNFFKNKIRIFFNIFK